VTTTGADEAEQTLTEVRRLRDRARSVAHGGVWFPVAVLAALLLLSITLYASPFREPHAEGDGARSSLPGSARLSRSL
jgi:hypothetical protein